jgi:glycerophosphoryl diester phosphodiesterase
MRKAASLIAMTLIAAFITSGRPPGARAIQVQGHRGARAMRPENTLPSFEYAIAAGVDVLELDVAVTKDNVLVVSHDPILDVPICTGPKGKQAIHSLTLAEVHEYDCGAQQNPHFPKQRPVPGTKMPTLDEVFSLAPRGAFRFNVETKIFPDHPELTPSPEKFAQLLLAEIRRHKLESRVTVQSFDFRTLHAMKKLDPAIPRAALDGSKDADYVALGREAEATIVSPEYHSVTPEKVKAAHEAGFEVIPWTSNLPEEWDSLIKAGVDAIITDDPAALIAYLQERTR